MFRPRVIPVLTLKGKGLVKTKRFNKQKAKYIGDPINAVKIFNDLRSDELIFLDITASIENRCISPAIIKDIGDEAYMPFSAGGGIQTLQQAKEIIQAGAEKVVICTAAIKNPELIKQISEHFGNQSVIICMDVAKNILGKYHLYSDDGKKSTPYDPIEYAAKMEEYGAGEIFINNIDRDGTMEGYDLLLIQRITQAINIPVIACGGAGKIEDIREVVINGHASAAAAGSLFVFHGQRQAVLINYPEQMELINLFVK